jgi:hypothetical protein
MTLTILPLLSLVALLGPAADAQTAFEVYAAIGIEEKQVLTGTVLTAKVIPGERKQVVAVTTYFTGKKETSQALNVRLDVFDREGEDLVSIFSRDFGALNRGYVGRGELQLIDLDGDGVSEIIVTYDDHGERLIKERRGEVIYLGDGSFVVGWSDVMEYDATRNARDVPEERRDRFVREIDFRDTIKTRGVTLFMNKRVIAVAGERLPEPKIVREAFPLKPADRNW